MAPHSLTGQLANLPTLFKQSIIPATNNLFTIGSLTYKWLYGYFGGMLVSGNLDVGGNVIATYGYFGGMLVTGNLDVGGIVNATKFTWNSRYELQATFLNTASTLSSTTFIDVTGFTTTSGFYSFSSGAFNFRHTGIHLIEILFEFTAVASSVNDYFDFFLYNNNNSTSGATNYIQWSGVSADRVSDRYKWTGTFDCTGTAGGMSLRIKRNAGSIANFRIPELKISVMNLA